MTGGSGWDLQEGDQVNRHKDHKHIVMTKADISDYGSSQGQLVVAKGENDLGAFISAGTGIVSPFSLEEGT